ncbi:MAG: hypothetical protein IT537_26705 [Hyphomicrobiales bacterium]|nr:hypothetical protein [Hyphomicrobiales bacterium]
MTSTVLTVSAAYVVIGVLLLVISLSARIAWWLKAAAIVVTSAFFVQAFYATRGLLSWPSTGALPETFQLLWVRVVEPDPRIGDRGGVYLWIEEVDENNVPIGIPRSFKLPYTRPLADRAAAAREEIMRGRPQQGVADDITGVQGKEQGKLDEQQGSPADPGTLNVDLEQYQMLQQAQRVQFKPMQGPILPPKVQ